MNVRQIFSIVDPLRVGTLWVVGMLATSWMASPLWAQNNEGPAIPPPEDISLTTSDGVKLEATYYPGTSSKETVPVILLHMFKGSRADYRQLAPYLRQKGYAVLVPDLRGHGESTSRRGYSVPMKASTLGRQDFIDMVRFDVLRAKQFLIDKNNDGELNIEKLVLVGAEMGASVAMNFARLDWNLPPEGNRKQGQDVKAVVLISPEWNTTGLPLRTALTGQNLTIRVWDPQLKQAFKEPETMDFRMPVALDFRREVSFLITVGKDNSRAVRDAKRLHSMLQPLHPTPSEDERAAKQDLFYGALDTSLQGTKLLGVQSLGLEKTIAQFIHYRAANRPFQWSERTNPYR